MAKFAKGNFAPAVKKEVPVVKEEVAEKEVIPDVVQEKAEEKVAVIVKDEPQEKPVPTHETIVPLCTLNRVFFGDKYFDLVEGKSISLPVGVVFELRERGIVE